MCKLIFVVVVVGETESNGIHKETVTHCFVSLFLFVVDFNGINCMTVTLDTVFLKYFILFFSEFLNRSMQNSQQK